MKRLVLAILFVFFLVGSVNAAPVTGSWNLDSGLNNGYWIEAFVGGGHGAQGNKIFAYGGSQWDVAATLDSVTTSSMSGYDYETTYIGSLSLFSAGPWSENIELSNVSFVNNSILTTEDVQGVQAPRLKFLLTGTTIQNGYKYGFEAIFNELEYPDFGLYDTAATMTLGGITYDAHAGYEFESLSVSVNAVPVPAAVWLLGSGLLGLIGIRRRAEK